MGEALTRVFLFRQCRAVVNSHTEDFSNTILLHTPGGTLGPMADQTDCYGQDVSMAVIL